MAYYKKLVSWDPLVVHVVHVVPAVSVGYIVPVVHFRSSGRRSARMNLVECVRAY